MKISQREARAIVAALGDNGTEQDVQSIEQHLTARGVDVDQVEEIVSLAHAKALKNAERER